MIIEFADNKCWMKALGKCRSSMKPIKTALSYYLNDNKYHNVIYSFLLPLCKLSFGTYIKMLIKSLRLIFNNTLPTFSQFLWFFFHHFYFCFFGQHFFFGFRVSSFITLIIFGRLLKRIYLTNKKLFFFNLFLLRLKKLLELTIVG